MLAVTNSDHGELKINNNETPTSDSASRICDVCGKQFDSKDKLKSHRKTHVKVQCTLCPKMVIAKHMPRHLRTVHKTDTTPASDTAIPAPAPSEEVVSLATDTIPAAAAASTAASPSEEVVSLAADTTPAYDAASPAPAQGGVDTDTFPASPAPAPAPSEEVVSLAADTTRHDTSQASTTAAPFQDMIIPDTSPTSVLAAPPTEGVFSLTTPAVPAASTAAIPNEVLVSLATDTSQASPASVLAAPAPTEGVFSLATRPAAVAAASPFEDMVIRDTGPASDLAAPPTEDAVSLDTAARASSLPAAPETSTTPQHLGHGLGIDNDLSMKIILYALEQDSTPMFEMGLAALDQICHLLKENPQFCESILMIPDIRKHVPESLLEVLDAGSQSTGAPPPVAASTDNLPSSSSSGTGDCDTIKERSYYRRSTATRQGIVHHSTIHKTSTSNGKPKKVPEYSQV